MKRIETNKQLSVPFFICIFAAEMTYKEVKDGN
jgi:hypothetical protein